MPRNLLEPTWMELDSDDHFDYPRAAGALSMRYRAQLDALRISSTPMHSTSGQAQDCLFPAAWNGASR
jgi:hypothetical protein